MNLLVNVVIIYILGLSVVTVSGEFCENAGTYVSSTWLVQCYGINSSTMYEVTNVLKNIKLTYPLADIAVDVSFSVGKDFPDDIFVGFRLISLTMTKCNFTDLPYGLLSNLPKSMIFLDFSDNFISTIDGQKFNQMSFAEGLLSLNLQNNQLKSLEEDSFVNYVALDSLYLQTNLLEELMDNAFHGLIALESLYLHGNNLINVGVDAFATLPNIYYMSMELNQITFLNNDTFSIENQPTLVGISLEGNPFFCNCSLQWLKDYLISINYLESSGATCAYPKYLPFALVDFCND